MASILSSLSSKFIIALSVLAAKHTPEAPSCPSSVEQATDNYGPLMNDSYNSRPATLRIPDPRRRLALFNDT
jgi:hypothetical protein